MQHIFDWQESNACKARLAPAFYEARLVVLGRLGELSASFGLNLFGANYCWVGLSGVSRFGVAACELDRLG